MFISCFKFFLIIVFSCWHNSNRFFFYLIQWCITNLCNATEILTIKEWRILCYRGILTSVNFICLLGYNSWCCSTFCWWTNRKGGCSGRQNTRGMYRDEAFHLKPTTMNNRYIHKESFVFAKRTAKEHF